MRTGLRWATSLCLTVFTVSLIAGTGSSSADDPRPFRAGFVEKDITPDIGMEAPGGYGKAYHTKVHDPCKVRAAVFHDGERVVSVVGIDALLIRKHNVEKVRQAITARCGIPGDAIMIAASHSHSAGPTGMILPGEYDHASDLVRQLAYEKSSTADPKYLERVERGLIDAVVEAHGKLAESRCAVGYGYEDRVAFNRRFYMRNGLTFTHPGQGNPDIIEAAGPIDPQVGVVGVWDRDGQLTGCIVNYACHATTGPGGISADYVYYIEQTIRGLLGKDVVVVFVPGMTGDITQVDNRSPYQIKQFGEISARLVGGRVGAEALRVLLSLEQSAGSLAPVAAKQKILQIPRRVPKPERVAKCRDLVQQDPSKVDPVEYTWAKEIMLLDARLAKEPVADVEVQAIQVGPAVFLSCPAEYFCEFGLTMKSGSPFPFTFPVSLANDCVGYVPTLEALGPRGGGYETRLTSYSNLIPAAGPLIAQTAIELSQTLHPGSAPLPALIPEFKARPWSYGNVPPELD